MFSRFFRGSIVFALTALMAPFAFAMDLPEFANTVGGEDVLIYDGDDIRHDESIDLVVAPNGDYYAAVGLIGQVGQGSDIKVYRSTDGGDTWTLFGTKGLGMSNSFLHPQLSMVMTPSPRLVLAYIYYQPNTNDWSVNVSRSPLGASANWTAMAVFDQPDKNFVRFHMTAAEAPGGTILYMAAEESDFENNDRIWFARSIDQSTSWQNPYVVASPAQFSTLDYQHPRVAGDEVGNVHVVWDVNPKNGSPYDKGVYYRHADNRAVQLADWDAPVVVAGVNDNYDTSYGSVGCLSNGLILMVSAMGTEQGSSIGVQWTATGDGVSWSSRWVNDGVTDFYKANIIAHPDGGWVISGHQNWVPNWGGSAWGYSRSNLASPPNWQDIAFMSDQNAEFVSHVSAAVVDPTRGNQIAMLWSDVDGPGGDFLRFDAEWRDGAGYPSLIAEFPSPGAPITDPLLHEVNPFRAGPELVYGDSNGKIHVIDTATGLDVPGWPQQIGLIGFEQTVAVGDIDGNGIYDVIASDLNGDVWAFRGDGQLLPGWPVNFGPGKSYVSLGTISKLAALDVVVTNTNSVRLVRPNGQEIQEDYWPRALGAVPVGPASLGDVNADGEMEVVITASDQVGILGSDGAILWAGGFAPGMVSPTALGDLNADGDLELLIPGGDGMLHARHHDGSVVAGFWPQMTSPGKPIVGLAMAKIDMVDGLEVAALSYDGGSFLFRSTGFPYTGFPKMNPGGALYYASPILDDVDGGRPELIAGDGDGWARGFKENDVDLGGWPKPYGGGAFRFAPVSGDVDADGTQKVIFLTPSKILKIDVNDVAGSPEDTRWPMFAHDAQRTSCAEHNFDAITPAPEFTQSVVSFAPPSPNPIRGQTILSFRLPESAEVSLEVFDLRGRKVRTLLGGTQEAGDHSIAWDARDGRGERVGQGQYFGRLVVQGQTVNEKLVQRMTVVR